MFISKLLLWRVVLIYIPSSVCEGVCFSQTMADTVYHRTLSMWVFANWRDEDNISLQLQSKYLFKCFYFPVTCFSYLLHFLIVLLDF